jgi:predicted TIM-barrel fold metal-dependent hydrolase
VTDPGEAGAGLFDVHTHFLPPRVRAKVLAQFDAAGPLIGRAWPITYRDSDETLVQTLRDLGVRRFSALAYAHRPGMAEWLNDWTLDFADRVPECLRCATFYPEPGVGEYVDARLAGSNGSRGVQLWKLHVQVGAFLVTDPLLEPAWAAIEEAGTPVILHAGSGPVGTEFTGPGPVAELLERYPDLPLVIAHLGAPEYAEFIDLAERFPRVCLDTTMAFTDFFADMGAPFPDELLARVERLGLNGKVLLGSDFPNIPYPYEHQLESLQRLGLGDEWLRRVCWGNAAGLFLDGPESP